MSHGLAVTLIAALDAFVVVALACVCSIPFVIGKPRRSASFVRTARLDAAKAVPALE